LAKTSLPNSKLRPNSRLKLQLLNRQLSLSSSASSSSNKKLRGSLRSSSALNSSNKSNRTSRRDASKKRPGDWRRKSERELKLSSSSSSAWRPRPLPRRSKKKPKLPAWLPRRKNKIELRPSKTCKWPWRLARTRVQYRNSKHS